MLIKNLISWMLVVAFCSGISSAQIRQRCVVSNGDILDRQVCDSNIKWKDSHIVWLLPRVFSSAKVPAGISIIFTHSGEEEKSLDFTPQNLILRNILDTVVLIQPQYQWKEENGVINVFPLVDYPILETRIAEFKSEGVTKSELIEKLLETDIFRNHLKENNLREEDSTGFFTTTNIKPKKYSLNLENATIREILNEIVRLDGNSTWMYGEYESKADTTQKIYRLGIYY